MIYSNRKEAQAALDKTIAQIKALMAESGVWVWIDSKYRFTASYRNELGYEQTVSVASDD